MGSYHRYGYCPTQYSNKHLSIFIIMSTLQEQNPIYKESVYISGPIAGYDMQERKLAFLKVQHMLESLGFKAVNPFDNGVADEEHWRVHMRADIKMLLECDAIYMMPGWELSKGCKLELDVASSCGIRLMLESKGI